MATAATMAAVVMLAACGGDGNGGVGPGNGSGAGFSADVQGDIETSIKGDALYGTATDPEAGTIFAIEMAEDDSTGGGLIFQGVAATLGLAAGAFIGRPDRKGALVYNDEPETRRPFARVLGAGPLGVPGGMGAQVMGELW